MNTIFYCLIFLQTTTICATHESIKVKHINQSDDSEQTVTITQKFDELYKKIESITHTNDKLKELYNGIVDAFIKHFITLNLSNCYFQYAIHYLSDYEPKKITDFCISNKAQLIKKAGLEEKDIDSAFDCAFNTFVEIPTFIMDTYKTIFNLQKSYNHQDITAFHNDLNRNKELLEKHKLSVEWLTKFAGVPFNYTLSHDDPKIYINLKLSGYVLYSNTCYKKTPN